MNKQELIRILAEEIGVKPNKAKIIYDVLNEMVDLKLLHALPDIEDRIEKAVMKRLSDTLAKF